MVACGDELKKSMRFRHALSVPSDMGKSENALQQMVNTS